MRYHYLEYFRGDDESLIDGEVRYTPEKHNYYSITETQFWDRDEIRLEFISSLKRVNEDFFRVTSGEFFGSDKFCEILKVVQPDISIIPIDARFAGGEKSNRTYSLIHPGKTVDAFDYFKSSYAGQNLIISEIEEGKKPRLVKGIKSVSIDAAKAGSNNFFFLANVIFFNPILSDSARECMIENKINVSFKALV